MKKLLSLFLTVVMLISNMVFICGAQTEERLCFDEQGKFRILVLADCQDDETPETAMMNMINFALDKEKPDLVIFTGDNVVVSSRKNFTPGAQALLQPLVKRDIPYAYTYGNHDAQYGVSKEFQYSVYKSIGRCLTYNADDSISGYGNCNLAVYASSGDDIAFNLWLIDSNMYENNNYDNVHKDQLDWFLRTDEALEASQGHKVNSLVFQHIAVPEIYEMLVEDPNGKGKYNDKRYDLSLNENANGYLGEFPCPPVKNSGEFDILKSREDVLGIVTGHDHINSFIGTWQGIDFIQVPGMSVNSYGDENVRGYAVIELDENDLSTYSYYTVKYTEKMQEEKENGIVCSCDCHKSGFYGFIFKIQLIFWKLFKTHPVCNCGASHY